MELDLINKIYLTDKQNFSVNFKKLFNGYSKKFVSSDFQIHFIPYGNIFI